jgi:hypothetical protein
VLDDGSEISDSDFGDDAFSSADLGARDIS